MTLPNFFLPKKEVNNARMEKLRRGAGPLLACGSSRPTRPRKCPYELWALSPTLS